MDISSDPLGEFKKNETEEKVIEQDEYEGIIRFRLLDDQGKFFFYNMMKYLSDDKVKIVKQ